MPGHSRIRKVSSISGTTGSGVGESPILGIASCVFVHGRLDDLVGFLLALDEGLDALHSLRGEALLTRLLTHPCRHMLNDVELALMLQGIRHLRIHHYLFHLSPLHSTFLIRQSTHRSGSGS